MADLRQALVGSSRADGAATRALDDLQGALVAEQALNAAPAERSEPRFYAVTLPIVRDQQAGTLELNVRARDRRDDADGEPSQPDVAHLTLSLPALGELRIDLTMSGPRINCQFGAESPFVEALVRASSGDLVTRLEGLGFRDPAVEATHRADEEPATGGASQTFVARHVRRVDARA